MNKKITSFFKLIRWSNLLITAIMMLLIYYCVMSPLSSIGIAEVMPSSPAFTLLLGSIIFIVAGGYVINDIFDVEIDKVNKPNKLLITNVFSEKEAKLFYKTLTFLGLLCGLISSIIILKSKFYTFFAPLVLLTCLLYSYSANYKKKLIIGNVIVSISVAFAVFLPWLFEILYLSNNTLILSSVKEILPSILPFILIYTAFAFIITLIREIVKDAEDYKGDMITRCRTLPIVIGIKKTKIILYLLTFCLYALLIYFHIILIKNQANIALCMLFATETGSLLSIINIYNSKESSDFHKVSVALKISMVFGILTMIFI